ncbi:phage-related exonuclease [Bartonella australis AUST/NH1]|uniref:Phage-related exonuclease n=1 Tax=Bartonella australis (strain Aust/NH1) TaxID=1094489 RepID=M1PE19_BARAA|nr:lambda exonuclease family protein [Bartonella australis]AGF74856.1 phage-related exonuclease [Bartonella australis AUST/NH1]
MEQRTTEWFKARLGKITASGVSKLFSGKATYEGYIFEKLSERLTGELKEHKVTAAMQWGIDHEKEALDAYAFATKHKVQKVFFINHPEIEMAGASPDGLVGDEGLVEVKCPESKTHIGFLVTGEPKEEYMRQMIFQMACTGRQWCDFMSYDPRFPTKFRMRVKRFFRDDSAIKKVEEKVIKALEEIDQMEEQLCSGGN